MSEILGAKAADPDHGEALPARHHPFRLTPDAYTAANRPLFLTVCADGRRPCLLENGAPGRLMAALHERTQTRRVRLIAAVILPDHVHLLAHPSQAAPFLAVLMRGLKADTSRVARAAGVADFRWQRSYWDRFVRDDDDLEGYVEYMRHNPVAQGLCERPGDWPHYWDMWTN